MNVLFVRHYHLPFDENSSGKPGVPRLPSNIFLAAYCEDLGFDVSVQSLVRDSHFDPSKSDVVVVYTPLLEGFTKHIKYLKRLKKQASTQFVLSMILLKILNKKLWRGSILLMRS